MARRLLLCGGLAIATITIGCSRSHVHEPEVAAGAEQGQAHGHEPLHGGVAVELGDHAFFLELVRDAAAGTLTLYVMDAHMENFVRIAAPRIALQVDAGDRQHMLDLEAVANPLTGETPGATATFVGQADWVRTTPAFFAIVPEVEVRGQTFSRVAFRFEENG